MCFIMLTAPAYADETDSAGAATLVDDNFDSYTSVEDMLNNNYKIPLGKPSCSIESESESESGNKFFRMSSKNDQIQADKYFTAVDDEKLEINVSFRNNNINFGKMLSVWQKDGGGNDFFYFLKIDAEGRICATNGNKTQDQFLMTAAADKWYTAKTVFDMKARKYTISVSDGEKTKTSQPTNFPNDKVTNINRLRFQSWPQSNGTIDFDDLCVKKTSQPTLPPEPEEPPHDEINISDDFESYTSAGDMGGYSFPFRKDLCSIKSDDDSNRFLRMSLNEDAEQIAADKGFAKTSEGILEVSVRVRSDLTALNELLSIWSSDNKYFYYFKSNGGKIYAGDGAEELMAIRPNTWYDVKAVFNLNAKTYRLTVSDGSTAKTSSVHAFDNAEVNDAVRIRMQCWWKMNGAADFDDLNIKSYMAAPSPEITFYNISGEASAKLTDVSTMTSKIKIDFKTYMDKDSLDGIRLVDSSNAEIKTEGVKTQKTYELVLSGTLKGKTIYSVIIPAGVKNVSGAALGEDKTVTFYTDTKTPGLFVNISDITGGGRSVTTLKELLETGKNAKINMAYLNGTEPDGNMNICVMTSYYRGERLIKTTVLDKTIDKETANASLQYDIPVENIEGIDLIKVFVWDTLDDMRAYCLWREFR